jgi:hypothetical protein
MSNGESELDDHAGHCQADFQLCSYWCSLREQLGTPYALRASEIILHAGHGSKIDIWAVTS